MSSEAFALVKSRRLGDGEVTIGGKPVRVPAQLRKGVLLLLAEYADEAWSCFPSQRRIAEELELGERTVRRALTSLEADQLVGRQHRHREDGTRTSDRFVVARDVIAALPVHDRPAQTRSEAIALQPELDMEHAATVTTGHSDHRPQRDATTGHSVRDYRPPVTAHGLLEEPLEEPTPAPPAAPTGATRRRDELWDAVLAACGIDPVAKHSKSARGAWNHALGELRELGATPDDVRAKAAAYRATWPTASLTPTALARRWSEVATTSPPASSATPAARLSTDPVDQARRMGASLAHTDVPDDELDQHVPWDPQTGPAFRQGFLDERDRMRRDRGAA